MANWKEYTTKTTPEDADEIVIADTKANANKRTPFSGLWNWIANKLATAVISQLETQNKSIIPALNELNSKRLRAYTLKANSTLTIELEYDTCYFLVTTGISNNDIPPLTTNVYTVTVAAKTRSSDVSIIHSDISNIEVSIEGNKLTLCSTAWKKIFIK
jgi:hypothetical protein|nr:MAG TPA: hypothetical protein [Caudoviricetes sp.]